jgi:hypothetical protein
MRTRKYNIGDKWGSWTIVDYPYASKKILLRCECGEERWRALANMAKTKEQKCRKCSQDFSGSKKTYYMVKSRANTRKISFDLTYEEWLEIAAEPCFYCGSEPANVIGRYKFVYNGVDRVVNWDGYWVGNCVACCKICNRAKSDMSLAEWDEWLGRIVTKRGEYIV